jgi:hypothetical protein
MNEIQQIKHSVSNFLSKDYKVLNLFYTKPCNFCVVKEEWESKLNFSPDILLIKESEYYFCFVLNKQSKIEEAKNYAKNHKFLGNFKIYNVDENKLFELKDEKFTLISDTLKFENTKITPISRPLKSLKEIFKPNMALGKKGEDELIKFFGRIEKDCIDLNFNSPCDTCSKIENWKKFNKLPDGILKEKNDLYFFDAKSKKSRKFIINYRDFEEYRKIEKIYKINVRIYFLLFDYNEKLKEIFQANLKVDELNLTTAWDGNKVIDLSKNLTQLY